MTQLDGRDAGPVAPRNPGPGARRLQLPGGVRDRPLPQRRLPARSPGTPRRFIDFRSLPAGVAAPFGPTTPQPEGPRGGVRERVHEDVDAGLTVAATVAARADDRRRVAVARACWSCRAAPEQPRPQTATRSVLAPMAGGLDGRPGVADESSPRSFCWARRRVPRASGPGTGDRRFRHPARHDRAPGRGVDHPGPLLGAGPVGVRLLPNTAGCRTRGRADLLTTTWREGVRTHWVKLE